MRAALDTFQHCKQLAIAIKRELVHFRFLAVLISTLVLLSGIALAKQWPEVYRASATISLDHTNVIAPLLRGAAEVSEESSNVKVADFLASRKILEEVASRIAFQESRALTPLELEKKVAVLRRGMEVNTQGRGDKALTITAYYADDPDTAYDILGVIIEVFLADRAAEKQKDSYEAYNFIKTQVNKYKSQLEDADERLKAFKERSTDVTENAVKERISDLSAQIKDLEIGIEETRETMKATKRQIAAEGQFLSERTQVVALEERKSVLNDELARLRLAYRDEYPDIVTLRSQLAEIDFQIEEKLDLMGVKVVSSLSELPLYEELRKQYASAELRLSTQSRRLTALKKLLNEEGQLADEVVSNQAELLDLTRDYTVTKKHYEEMLARKENAKLTMELNNEGQGENYKLVQPPNYPLNPEGVSPLFILFAVPFIALLVPIAIAFAFVMFDPRVRSVESLENTLPDDVQVLSVIPHQGTPINARLLKKDMLLIISWLAVLGSSYAYFMYRWLTAAL